MTSYRFLVLVVVLALSSYASAFFLNWGSPERTSPAPTHYYYHKRYLPAPVPSYTIESEQRNQIPSVPVQVPLQAQLAPLSTVQNVQLVPCLCPVSQDYSYETLPQQQENIYLNGVPLQQIPQQQQQQPLQPQQLIQQQQKP